MIAIFFVPGMFGSTIEYLLRTFNNDFEKNECKLLSDGSMHSYKKEFHPISVDEILSQNSVGIATPIYPFKEKHFPEILKIFQDRNFIDLPILLYADSVSSAELNMLFQYHKIAFGAKIKMGLGIFCGDNTRNIVNWNKDYTHWNQMQINQRFA